MHIRSGTLWITSADHQGVLEIVERACSFTGEMQRCLPLAATLHQHHRTHQIAITHGVIYINLSNVAHNLPHSSQQLAPNDIMVFMHTARGTLVTVRGNLDQNEISR